MISVSIVLHIESTVRAVAKRNSTQQFPEIVQWLADSLKDWIFSLGPNVRAMAESGNAFSLLEILKNTFRPL